MFDPPIPSRPTRHEVVYADATRMRAVQDSSVDLIVTSPPYPMIEMWDSLFSNGDPAIGAALKAGRGREAFESMHRQLDPIWKEAYRVLRPGAILCINIGDATRSLAGNFELYSSHSRILTHCLGLGFQNLPNIIWRKTTNAPNKFMGSGMLPPGAYVTLEHEYILIFRKGPKRSFLTQEEKRIRQESAFFWEERNRWFSDVWFDLVGVGQDLEFQELRQRSAAFPFELAYRLINMFSVKHDLVLDPFLGTGTTMLAAMASERNSMGYEVDREFHAFIASQVRDLLPFANSYIHDRLDRHLAFIRESTEAGRDLNATCIHYGFPCISRQEKHMLIRDLLSVTEEGEGAYSVSYSDAPQTQGWSEGDAEPHRLLRPGHVSGRSQKASSRPP